MFVSGSDPKRVRKSVDQIHEAAAKNGRAPGAIKVIVAVIVIVDETDEKAQAKYEDYLSYADEEGMYALFGGWTGIDLSKFDDDEDFRVSGPGLVQGLIASWSDTAPESSGGGNWTKRRMAREFAIGGVHPRTVGSAKTTADFLQQFQEVSGVDGFNIGGAIYPADLEAVVKHLLPELRARGLFWDDYEASTARENYSGDGQGPRLRWDHPGTSYQWHSE